MERGVSKVLIFKRILKIVILLFLLSPVLLFAFMYWGETHERRSDIDIYYEIKITKYIEQDAKLIPLNDVFDGNWDVVCFIDGYDKPEDILKDYDVSAPKGIYSDNYWGIALVSSKRDTALLHIFKHLHGSLAYRSKKKCFDYTKAVFRYENKRLILESVS